MRPVALGAIRCYQRSGMTITGQERKYFKRTRREHVFNRMAIERRRFDQLVSEGALPAEPALYVPHLAARRPGPPVAPTRGSSPTRRRPARSPVRQAQPSG